MSVSGPVNSKLQESSGIPARGTLKCRIPQRQNVSGGAKLPASFIPKAKSSYNNESTPRPKSANRLKEEMYHHRLKQTFVQPRATKQSDRIPITAKRPSALPRKANNAELLKSARTVIMVPVNKTQIPTFDAPDKYNTYEEAIKTEDMEQEISEMSPTTTAPHLRYDEESLSLRGNKLVELKIIWQDKMVQFENMKGDLKELQKNILALYAKMRETYEKMSELGENPSLPPPEDLRIMNVSNLSPEQLLQLCAGDDSRDRWNELKTHLSIDMNKLYEMPSKLVHTCEQTLVKRKEIIDWFECLKSQEKGISVHKLSKKINEFNAENDMLKCSLDGARSEFLKELEEIVGFMRKSVNETMATQLRIEELTLEMSQLNSQNIDLRKQLYNSDHLRSQTNRNRMDELEKELKEEKCKRLIMRDRLSRSDGQVKINAERASQLEVTLEQARSQIWSLERTIQQLHDQNEKLQSDFDKELSKLTESIKEHTVHLEEIADAREKLQTEKDDLEKRLAELSAYYNESLVNMKKEVTTNVAKVLETEKKYEEQTEEKKKLEIKLEVICNQLLEAEVRNKNAMQQLQEKEALINKENEVYKELEATKQKLEESTFALSENMTRITELNEAIKDIEGRLKTANESVEALRSELFSKNNYIAEMESKQLFLEQQLSENENKMEAYVEQLSTLKVHINRLQDDFGEFDSLNNLHEMLHKQRSELLEATRLNEELAEALQKKETEVKKCNENLSEHEKLLIEKENVIKVLSEKEEEQSKIIRIMKSSLELRSQVDNDLNQKIMEKDTEIESLLVNLDTRKQQISHMEDIILTLEDQTRKGSLQRKKDQDHIMSLQKKIAEYEDMNIETTNSAYAYPENLDSLIKILEDELEMENNTKAYTTSPSSTLKKKSLGDRRREKLVPHDNIYNSRYKTVADVFPPKKAMGNHGKKIFNYNNEDQNIVDSLNRKRAITNIETQRWVSTAEHQSVHPATVAKENTRRVIPNSQLLSRNLQYLNSDQQRDDKTYKMLKIAGHRL